MCQVRVANKLVVTCAACSSTRCRRTVLVTKLGVAATDAMEIDADEDDAAATYRAAVAEIECRERDPFVTEC